MAFDGNVFLPPVGNQVAAQFLGTIRMQPDLLANAVPINQVLASKRFSAIETMVRGLEYSKIAVPQESRLLVDRECK